jgi:hypothetical protein
MLTDSWYDVDLSLKVGTDNMDIRLTYRQARCVRYDRYGREGQSLESSKVSHYVSAAL